MGLDMFAFKTKHKVHQSVDFKVQNAEELHYWRKHPDLHAWMEKLYRSKRGRAKAFNLVNLRLLPADLDELEASLRRTSLPKTSGLMFGQSVSSDAFGDLLFLERARQAIRDGYTVYYSSWW